MPGRHGGASRLRKLRSLLSRSRATRRFARRRAFDLAVGHGSNDLALTARRLGVPAVNMFDYEFATYQHNVGCRLSHRVMTPDSIPPERLQWDVILHHCPGFGTGCHSHPFQTFTGPTAQFTVPAATFHSWIFSFFMS